MFYRGRGKERSDDGQCHNHFFQKSQNNMKDNAREIIQKNTSDLIPYERNPRVNDNAVDKVANSIREFGFKSPIIIDEHNVIICGHTRLKAAKKLGLKEVPVIVARDLTDEQIKAYRLVDNKVSELAEWDTDLLETEMSGLPYDFGEFGFDGGNLKDAQIDKDIDLTDAFEVIVECKDESEQKLIFDELSERGLKCRVLTL